MVFVLQDYIEKQEPRAPFKSIITHGYIIEYSVIIAMFLCFSYDMSLGIQVCVR